MLPIQAPAHEDQDGQVRRILCAAAHALYRHPLLAHATIPDGPITWGELCRLTALSDEHLWSFADSIRRAAWLLPNDSLQPVNRLVQHCEGNGAMLEVFFQVQPADIPTGMEVPTQWMPRIIRPDALTGKLLGHRPAGDAGVIWSIPSLRQSLCSDEEGLTFTIMHSRQPATAAVHVP